MPSSSRISSACWGRPSPGSAIRPAPRIWPAAGADAAAAGATGRRSVSATARDAAVARPVATERMLATGENGDAYAEQPRLVHAEPAEPRQPQEARERG